MAINDSAEVFDCDAFIFIDDTCCKLKIPDRCMIFHPLEQPGCYSTVRERYAWVRGRKGERKGEDSVYAVPFHGYGTATIAVTILGLWGIRELLMVGFDSMDTNTRDGKYADCITKNRTMPFAPCQSYIGISQGIRAAIAAYNIEARWFHRGERFDG